MEANCRRSWRLLRSAPFFLFCTLALTSSSAAAQTPATFTAAGDMTAGRSFHVAVELRDRTLLVVGENSADIYDPATRGFTATGTMTTARMGATATLLDDGRVLIAGGNGSTLTAELYDPTTRTFTRTGDRSVQSRSTTAMLLKNGKVLFLGGVPELFDPSTGTFATGAGESNRTSSISTVTLLADGRILIAGEPVCEIYDPETDTFSVTGGMTTPLRLFGPPLYISGRTATLLTSGKVLLVGGHNEDWGRFADAELYDPATGTFTPTGTMARARDNHTATLLADGKVLITGGESHMNVANGWTFSGTEASAEIYDPATGLFTTTGSMAARRGGHTATLLANGEVLITGGYYYGGIGMGSCCFASAEVFAGPLPAERRRRRSVPH